MKTHQRKDSKQNYLKIKKMVKRAEKLAEEFIKANKKIDPQLRVNYF